MRIDVRVPGVVPGTNVLDVQIPPHLRIRHSTGWEWFDRALDGGLVPSTSLMLTGSPGVGKSTLIRQLADKLMGEGHLCLLNSGEESTHQIAAQCERLKLSNGFLISPFTMLDDVLDLANDFTARAGTDTQLILIQDSLQTLDDGKYTNSDTNSKTPVRCCLKLVEWAKKPPYPIVLFVCQVTKNGTFSGRNTIKHAVDVHANMYVDDDNRSVRMFECLKNRWGPTDQNYAIEMGANGLVAKEHECDDEYDDVTGRKLRVVK